MLAALGRAEEVGLGPKWSVLGGVRAEKCAKPKREGSQKGHAAEAPEAAEASFLLTDF